MSVAVDQQSQDLPVDVDAHLSEGFLQLARGNGVAVIQVVFLENLRPVAEMAPQLDELVESKFS